MNLVVGACLSIVFAIGTFQILRRDIIRLIIGFALQSIAINLLIISAGNLPGTRAPFAGSAEHAVDPLVQAMVLTAIVIFLGAFSFLLATAYRLFEEFHSLEVDEMKDLKE